MDKKYKNYFTTKAGTKLPILDLRGQDYLEVKYRIMWFREECPNHSIITEIVSHTDQKSVVRASIVTPEGRIIAQASKDENTSGFPDHLPKAETSAIGRALALCGYGTQFCGEEMDEGERLADAPAQPVTRAKKPVSEVETLVTQAKALANDAIRRGKLKPEEFKVYLQQNHGVELTADIKDKDKAQATLLHIKAALAA